MRFAPKTEEEIDTRVLLPAGEYSATVVQATDEVSKSEKRNEQIHLVLRVEDDLGNRNTVHDYLLEAMAGKLRHFCEAAGLMDEYQSGDLSALHCSGQDVRVKLAIEHDKSGQYPDKNVVRDYVVANGQSTAKQAPVKPATAPPTAGTDSPKRQAWNAWLSAWSRFLNEFPAEAGKRDATWQTCFSDFFPNQEPSQVTDREWERFRLAVPKWDPINGWSKAKVPPASPISKESVFDEADIPF